MQFEPPLEAARLLRRYQRFFADIETLAGERLTVHCPNTGAMRHCLVEGGQVWFSRSKDPRRKLPGTWELAQTPHGRLACINTARANPLVEEALRAGRIEGLEGFSALRREVRYGTENSRIDFCLDYAGGPSVYLEVKSVTLGFADSTVAAFPDTVSARASKHLRELAALARQGGRAVLLYCVNLSGISAVRAAEEIDPAYARALAEARAAGVEVRAVAVELSVQGLQVTHALPVLSGAAP
ncbi:DNA/RNA nuclease SfsA [Pseudomonas sp. NW5]|uniref:DNA/RNA nuclease SfsA n=1 Tax=Pseudomonas sp. NW5 TaxID=2934934 RepID=UPI0020214B20|nr:DNA/RNA nuclease SfsA [Pseudomonas sp. NW5]MCL7461989.1 DNA/RNA nuclease SfsA [Pseudomonas sp. NW5]